MNEKTGQGKEDMSDYFIMCEVTVVIISLYAVNE